MNLTSFLWTRAKIFDGNIFFLKWDIYKKKKISGVEVCGGARWAIPARGLQQLIWGNKDIKFNGKCLIYNKWMKDNILFINDNR